MSKAKVDPSHGPHKRGAAFFDLDGTLVAQNTAHLFARHEFRRGALPLHRLLEATVYLALHRLAVLDIESAYQRAAKHWAGRDEAEVIAGVRAWFANDVTPRLAPGARPVLEAHRERGEPLVLLTNSSCHIADAACTAWQLDAWLANPIPAEAGRLTGTMELPLCYGTGKVTRAEAWAANHGVDLSAPSFYTDSLSDLPMLERVGHAYAVAPDPRLRRIAKRRGWPVLDWSARPG